MHMYSIKLNKLVHNLFMWIMIFMFYVTENTEKEAEKYKTIILYPPMVSYCIQQNTTKTCLFSLNNFISKFKPDPVNANFICFI